MQTPSASDPSFKAFLDKLQEQNNRGFVSQLVQLKAERENAGEDNDKREQQLDDVISSLKEVKSKNIPGIMAKTKQIPPTTYIEYFKAFKMSSFFLVPLLASLMARMARRGNITWAIQRMKVTERNLL